MSNDPMQQEGYTLMAAAFDVYNEMGHGFTEDIYQESLEDELASRKVPYVAHGEVLIYYKQKPLRKKLRPDLIVYNDIIVELKAVSTIVPDHEAQLLNYMKAAQKPVGYLINFGASPKLEWKRFARTRKN